MTIKDFKYFPFSLQLKIPFQSSAQTIKQRDGIIISLTDELGNQYFGEASPLPGFSKETINDLIQNLSDIKTKLVDLFLMEDLYAINDQLSIFMLVPSLRFALEQAILSLMINRNKNFVNQFVGNLKSEINVNAVLGFGETNGILSAIEEKINDGYYTVKIKIGRSDFEDDLKLISGIRQKFGDEVNLRLDVNGKWELNDAEKYLERLSTFNIQYIEEPCNNINKLITLAQSSPIPLAVDESVHTIEDAYEVINNSNVEFIVWKPMILGRLIALFRVIKEAEKKNKKIIISSSFESAVGKSGLVFLTVTTNHNFAHGLDTSQFFENDICTDPFTVKAGKINLTPGNYPPHFNLNLK